MSPRNLCCFLLISAASALAHAGGGTADAVGSDIPDLGSSAVQVLLALLLVFALLLGTLWLLKRLQQPRGSIAGLLKVIAGVAVGTRERVVIVELGNSWLVLGVAPGQVSTLAEIPRQELPAAANATNPDFALWLKKFIHRREQN